MDLTKTIQAAKRRCGNEQMPDTALAAILGIAGPTFARDKRAGFSDPIALKLAQLAGEDPAIVLATVRAMRERDPAVKRVLERLVKLAASAAGAAVLAMGLSTHPAQRQLVAERVGYEPTVPLPVRLISSQVHSTTLPPLRVLPAMRSSPTL